MKYMYFFPNYDGTQSIKAHDLRGEGGFEKVCVLHTPLIRN